MACVYYFVHIDWKEISVVCSKEFLITYKLNVNESSEFYSWIHILKSVLGSNSKALVLELLAIMWKGVSWHQTEIKSQ